MSISKRLSDLEALLAARSSNSSTCGGILERLPPVQPNPKRRKTPRISVYLPPLEPIRDALNLRPCDTSLIPTSRPLTQGQWQSHLDSRKALGDTLLGPLPGPQSDFIVNPARMVITGGAAGGGKTAGLILDAFRYASRLPHWRGVIFRRQSVDLFTGGGVWDTACEMLTKLCDGVPGLSIRPVRSPNAEIRFSTGAVLSFRHLQNNATCENYRSSQFPWIGFEEATQFTQYQVLYFLSRNRSPHGYPCRIRLTTNPDAESWLCGFLSWWIDPQSGYADPRRATFTRYFYRGQSSDLIEWYDSVAQAHEARPDMFAEGVDPTSVSFIPSNVKDNTYLYHRGSEYVAGLMMLPEVERERLLRGNWLIVANDGLFKRDWLINNCLDPRTFDRSKIKKLCRAWDLASTPKTPTNDPDYTVGALIGIDDQNRAIILNIVRGRWDSADVEATIETTARTDMQTWGKRLKTVIEIEGGSSGKAWVGSMVRKMAAYSVEGVPAREDKVARSKPLATQAKAGNVFYLKDSWADEFLSELYRFPYGAHDDQVDAACHAYSALAESNTTLDVDAWRKIYSK